MSLDHRWRGISASRVGLACLHLGVAGVSFLRPNLTRIVPSYAAFQDVMPTVWWGAAALTIGLGLLLLPRGSLLLILWQAFSATLFTVFAIFVTQGPYGLTWGSVVYGGLAVWSVLLSYYTFDDWWWRTGLPKRLRAYLRRRRGQP